MIYALDVLTSEYGAITVALTFGIMLFAGFTKGAVGFALPMITISGAGSLMSAELAIAAIILPGLVTNFWQSLRNGIGEAVASVRKYWRLTSVLLVSIYAFAQLVTIISDKALFLVLGIGVTLFGSLQLSGWTPYIPRKIAKKVEPLIGAISGFFGGLAGVWGPPILLYLISQNTPKAEMVRVQGITFLVGAAVLTGAHLQSGLLDEVTAPFSAMLIVPAMIGMAIGLKVQDRMDQQKFRKAMLMVLLIAGLNLLRRGLFG